MAEEKSSNSFRNLLIVIILLVIIGFSLFLIYQAKIKNVDGLSNTVSSDNTNTNDDGLTEEELIQKAKEELLKESNLVQEEDNNNTIWWVIGFLILFIVIALIIYFYYFRQKEEKTGIKQPVPINKIKEIFKETISKEYGLAWFYDDGIFKLKNDTEFKYRNQRVWYHRQTGDKFLLIEFIVNNGPNYGFHMANIPADKGEQSLREGEWTLIHKTDMDDFKLLGKTYPVTSIVDKNERQQMYIAEQIASGDMPKESLEYMQQQKPTQQNTLPQSTGSKPAFASPFSKEMYGEEDFDEMDTDEGITNMSSTAYPRRSTSSYRRRRR